MNISNELASVVLLPKVAEVASHLTDVTHELALVMLSEGSTYAIAVCFSDGGVLTWDGWYGYQPPVNEVSASELPWEEWEDMPSKLLMRANRASLSGEMIEHLMPTYSPAQIAGEWVGMGVDDITDSEQRKRLRRADVVCYIPVVDRGVFDLALEQELAERRV